MNFKKLFGYFAVLLIAVVTAINVHVNSKEDGVSDTFFANVEALANNESGDTYGFCLQSNYSVDTDYAYVCVCVCRLK